MDLFIKEPDSTFYRETCDTSKITEEDAISLHKTSSLHTIHSYNGKHEVPSHTMASEDVAVKQYEEHSNNADKDEQSINYTPNSNNKNENNSQKSKINGGLPKRSGRFRALFRIGRKTLVQPSIKFKRSNENVARKPEPPEDTLKPVPDSIIADMVTMDLTVASMGEINKYD